MRMRIRMMGRSSRKEKMEAEGSVVEPMEEDEELEGAKERGRTGRYLFRTGDDDWSRINA